MLSPINGIPIYQDAGVDDESLRRAERALNLEFALGWGAIGSDNLLGGQSYQAAVDELILSEPEDVAAPNWLCKNRTMRSALTR